MEKIKKKIKEDEDELENEIENSSSSFEDEICDICEKELNHIINEADNIEEELIKEGRELGENFKNINSKNKKSHKKSL